MEVLLLNVIKWLYVAFNSVRVFSYIPQIITVAKEKSQAKALSLLTWFFWTGANITTALYAHVILKDDMLTWMSLGNSLGCMIVIGIVIYKRLIYAENKFAFQSYDTTMKRKRQIDLFA